MSDSEPEVLAYEGSPPAETPTDGVSVADYGNRVVITGPQPRPWTITGIVLWASAAAGHLACMIYASALRLHGWRSGPNVVLFTLLFTGVLALQFGIVWRSRRPRVTEVAPDGVSVTDPLTLTGLVRYPRDRIRCMHLVHDDVTQADGTPACTLRLILRRERGALPPLFGKGKGVVILTGPAPHLREIGDRIRQVLDYSR